jgi:thiopeptide-type bacteriocin biosynthesis protein
MHRAAPLFDADPTMVARLATLPVDRAGPTLVDLRPDDPGYPDRLRAYLAGLIADPVFREAVEVSSSSLAGALDRIESGAPLDLARLERTAFAATRYLLRMTSRPTPFGLLAGVSTAEFGDTTKVRLGPAHRKYAEPDAAWLASLAGAWLDRPAVRDGLQVTANALCSVRGDRLVLNHPRGEVAGDGTVAREVSVRYTVAVGAALDAARLPVGYRELAALLVGRFPGAGPGQIDALLDSLVDKEFLLTDLSPDPTRPDPLGHLLARLGDDAERVAISAAGTAVEEYAGTGLGAGRGQWRAAVDPMRALHATDRPPVQVDLRLDAELRLPAAVAEEAVRAGTALCRMARTNPYEGHLTEYLEAFLERYGTDRLVPLLELLDPHAGLDAPAGYLVPTSSREDRRRGYPHEPDGERAALVAELAWVAGTGGEVTLTDDLVDQLGQPTDLPPPAAVELCVQVLAGSAAALDRGEFLLAFSPASGTTRPGAMAGRFARMLDLSEHLAGWYARAATEGMVWAQVLWRPVSERLQNVTRVPRVVEHTIPVGVYADRADPTTIGLDELAVGATHDRLYLVRTTDGARVEPVIPHVLNPKREAPNAARLLLDLAQTGTRALHWWNWGQLESLPALPRVRYGRTIVVPARWTPDPELGRSTEPWPRWCDRLAAWRDRWAVPDRVEATIADHRVELDLSVGLHRQLLRQELRRGHKVAVLECVAALGAAERPPADGPAVTDGRSWLGGHVAEFVVQLTRAPAVPVSVPPVVGLPARPLRRHLPGGEWLYAKLYATEQSQPGLLATELPRLVDDLPPGVDRWFVVRYRDPEPHLRLRLHGDPGVLAGTVLPRLHDWAADLAERRMARLLLLDTYEPETERYGGPELMDAAEDLFCADSRAVVDQLAVYLRHGRPVAPEILLAANLVDLLRGLGDWDWTGWVLHQMERAPLRGVDRGQLAVIDPGGGWSRLRALPGGPQLLAAWAARSEAVAKYGSRLAGHPDADRIVEGILHMHANRLLGVDRATEDLARAIVRDRVHARLARVGRP